MAGNFPEIWSKRFVKQMEQADKAPWLEGISEVDGDVTELGAGTTTEKNVIHVAIGTFEPAVLINNNTYPINAVAYSDTDGTLTLNKFQTEVTTLSDDQVMGASYDKIDAAQKSHILAITKKKVATALHALAPAGHTANTPVLRTTGDVVSGRKRLTYDDLVALKAAMDATGVDADGRRIVLCTEHWNDLLIDRKNFGDQLANYNTGNVAPIIAGFKVYQYINNPLYIAAGTKKAFGSSAAAGDYAGSIAFHERNVAKKSGNTKQYFLAAAQNPRNQSNELNYRHYYVVMPFQAKAIGAIVSAPQ